MDIIDAAPTGEEYEILRKQLVALQDKYHRAFVRDAKPIFDRMIAIRNVHAPRYVTLTSSALFHNSPLAPDVSDGS